MPTPNKAGELAEGAGLPLARGVEEVATKSAGSHMQSFEGAGLLDDVMQLLQHHLLQSPLAEAARLSRAAALAGVARL